MFEGCPDGCGYGLSLEGGAHNEVTDNVVARTTRDGIRASTPSSPRTRRSRATPSSAATSSATPASTESRSAPRPRTQSAVRPSQPTPSCAPATTASTSTAARPCCPTTSPSETATSASRRYPASPTAAATSASPTATRPSASKSAAQLSVRDSAAASSAVADLKLDDPIRAGAAARRVRYRRRPMARCSRRNGALYPPTADLDLHRVRCLRPVASASRVEGYTTGMDDLRAQRPASHLRPLSRSMQARGSIGPDALAFIPNGHGSTQVRDARSSPVHSDGELAREDAAALRKLEKWSGWWQAPWVTPSNE